MAPSWPPALSTIVVAPAPSSICQTATWVAACAELGTRYHPVAAATGRMTAAARSRRPRNGFMGSTLARRPGPLLGTVRWPRPPAAGEVGALRQGAKRAYRVPEPDR